MDPKEKTSRRIRGNSAVTVAIARPNQPDMTEAERILWAAIRNKQVDGLRFRSQHPVGPFIPDFYCPACRLGVEVDGSVHFREELQDSVRTAHMKAYGYRVIRFTNEAIMYDLSSVLDSIRAASRPVAPETVPTNTDGSHHTKDCC